jgi:hypothetical protein
MPAHAGYHESEGRPVAPGGTASLPRRGNAARTATATLLLGILFSASALPAEEGLTRESRILLIRGLVKEIGVAKVALPRNKRGVTVTPQGIDQKKHEEALRSAGVGVKPGMPTEITKISFKSDEIVLEVNGGPHTGKRWYEHIEVSTGVSARRVGQGNGAVALGSVIHLAFEKRVPDLSLAQAKQMLSAVLDFERHSPTVLYAPDVPPHIKEAIKNHEVVLGMSRDAVLSARGMPDRKVREVRDGVEVEDWIYGLPPHVLMVTFDSDTVSAVHQY